MYRQTKQLPAADSVRHDITEELKQKKFRFDELLKRNMSDKKRLAVVIGPCSADDPNAVVEYAQKIMRLQETHRDLLIVLRVYTSKPHSDGSGFKGRCFQNHENGLCDLSEGINICRKMMKSVLETGLPIADELLFPELYVYFSDFISYYFVGARSSEDSLHRGFASGLDLPCGLKNPTNGLIEYGVNCVKAASAPCVFPFGGAQVETDGNPYAHIVLRGGSDRNGYFANLSHADTEKCDILLKKHGLNDFLVVDLSHANSGKIAVNQLKNAKIVAADKNVDGVMAESYLFGGTSPDSYGVSKTDDCLGMDDTARLFDILNEGFVKR